MTAAQTVSILGAGAVGAALAARFYEMDPASVAFVASGARYERLKAQGVIVNGTRYAIPVLAPGDPAPPSDLVIVALKHQHLAGAVRDLVGRVGDGTAILSVMNGLDSEDILADAWGRDKVLYALAVGIDAVRDGNRVTYSKLGKVVFGEPDNTTPSPRVQRIQALFARAAIPYETPQDMIRALWWKFMVNVGVNQASAVLRAPYGVFHRSEHARAIMEAAMREVIALAGPCGVDLGAADIDDWYSVLDALHPEGKTSMLQDIEAGRETEVAIFAGKVIALGKQHGIPTPVNTLLWHAIKVLEGRG